MQVYSATKLVTARNISIAGRDFVGNVNFDGTGNVSLNGAINYCTIKIGDTDPNPFKRIAHIKVARSWNDNALLLYISQGYHGGNFGLCRVEFRTLDIANSDTAGGSVSIRWLIRQGYATDSIQAGYYIHLKNAYVDVFLKTTGAYQGTVIRVIQDSRGSINNSFGLINSTSNTEAYTSLSAAATALYNVAYQGTVSGTDTCTVSHANSATKLQTPRTIWGQSFDGTANVSGSLSGVGHIQFSADNSYSIGTTTSEAAHTYTRQVWARHLNASRVYTGDTNLYIGYSNTAQVKFYSGTKQSGDGSNERMTISTNGNIGIGTTSPLCKLHVVGDILATDNLSVTGLIYNKGILPANYEFNNKGTNCYVSADALCSEITAITDSIPISNVDIHYSNDNGTNWTKYPKQEHSKFNLYANNAGLSSVYLGYNVIPPDIDPDVLAQIKDEAEKLEQIKKNEAEKLAQIKKNQLMFTFEVPNNCYSQVYFASVDMSNGVNTICTVEILNNSGAVVETFTKHMNGWNQINYISLLHDGNAGYAVGNNNRRYIRFKFKHDQKTTALRNAIIYKIRIFSFTKYSFPTDRFMGHTGHIYNFDYNMNTYFPNSILAKGGVTAYQSSDIRLKQDLRKLDYLGIIKAMGGTFGFAWKKDNTRSIGWIAQHVLCNPHLKDIVETDEKGYYKINYWSPKLIATAFGAIEQVDDEVSRLKARVVFLESEVQRLSGDKEDCNKKRLDNKNINSLN